MEIGCEKCGTRFELDESLIKDGGSKVRCSVCKHVFTAYPPEEPPDMESPAEGEAAPVPEASVLPADTPVEADAGVSMPDDELRASGDPFPAPDSREEIALEGFEDAEPGFDKEVPVSDEQPAFETETVSAPEAGREGDDGDQAAVAGAAGETEDHAPPEGPRKKSRWLAIVLIVILVLAGAAGAYYYFKPEPAKKMPDAGVSRLSFESVTSSFVNSREGGLLFVIRGKVKNNYPDNRSRIRVKASVLNDKGQVVKRQMTYAGNTYKKEEIRILPLSQITKAMNNPEGMSGRNLNVAPGAVVDFMIVFDHSPETLSEFTVEAVSSSPAKP